MGKSVVTYGLLLLLIAMIPTVQAQQTIFNVPSADVTDAEHVYVEHETQASPTAPDAYWIGTHYAALGLSHNSELDATLYNLTSPASNNVSLGLGFKSVIPIELVPTATQLKWTVGSQLLISLAGKSPGVWTYSHLSGCMPKTKTRLTAGLSGGTETLFGRDTVHFIAGLEQPVTKQLSILADWFSGTHGLGLLTLGVSYAWPRSHTTVFLGYHIPNSNRVLSQSGLTFELAKLF